MQGAVAVVQLETSTCRARARCCLCGMLTKACSKSADDYAGRQMLCTNQARSAMDRATLDVVSHCAALVQLACHLVSAVVGLLLDGTVQQNELALGRARGPRTVALPQRPPAYSTYILSS